MTISVNGVTIPQGAVAREMQHHPADSREQAEREAATALVVRELLLQRASDLAIEGNDDDERIAKLIELEIAVPQPSREEIERYYRRNALRFMPPALYEASHIFFPVREGANEAEAKSTAEGVLAQLVLEPQRFADLALAHSACSSKEQGGALGQVAKGDTNPELDQAMARMEVGSIKLVRSRHGFHILRLDRRIPGKQLEIDQISGWIEDHLRSSCERRALAQYLQLLTARAKIEGVELAVDDSPLVQ